MRACLIACGLFGLAVLAFVLAPPTRLSAQSPSALQFAVLKSGAEIGHLKLVFTQDNGSLVVDTDVEMRVRFAFITVYRFQHRARETWHDGRFVAIDAWTHDKGREFQVSARREGDRINVTGDAGRYGVSPDTVPKSYWNRRILEVPRVFDTQWGSLLELVVDAKGREGVEARGALVTAERFRLRGFEVKEGARQRDPWIDIELWYDAEDRLVRMAFEYLGFDFVYVLR
jgi:hypothetical protein